MIYTDESTVKIDTIILPGLFKSIEIKGDAIVDEQDVEGRASEDSEYASLLGRENRAAFNTHTLRAKDNNNLHRGTQTGRRRASPSRGGFTLPGQSTAQSAIYK